MDTAPQNQPIESQSTDDTSVISQATAPCPPATRTGSADAQVAENFIEIYHAISEWIRFADAKAAVLLTVGGAMSGFLIPSFARVVRDEQSHLLPFWGVFVTGFFILYVTTFIWSAIQAFLCINPITERGRHPAMDHCPHFHPAAISYKYTADQAEAFVQECEKLGADGLRKEIQIGILLDSHVSARKYTRVSRSLRMFAISSAFGFIYFLISQF